jgi:hypothetical protein
VVRHLTLDQATAGSNPASSTVFSPTLHHKKIDPKCKKNHSLQNPPFYADTLPFCNRGIFLPEGLSGLSLAQHLCGFCHLELTNRILQLLCLGDKVL